MAYDFHQIFRTVYEENRAIEFESLYAHSLSSKARPNTFGVAGGAYGDEGKGKVVDKISHTYLQKVGMVFVYRWNGGANAGHTVQIGSSRIALHQLPSGAMLPNATAILGKGMVIHPEDLVTEIEQVTKATGGDFPATLYIDPMAVLSLDTHRAYEANLKQWHSGGSGATGRGISPAYADVLYRHPLRIRDLLQVGWEQALTDHYNFYRYLISGLTIGRAKKHNQNYENEEPLDAMSIVSVPSLAEDRQEVGRLGDFLERLGKAREVLQPYVQDVYSLVRNAWGKSDIPFVFEGAQGVGLDPRHGVYPDVTASDPTFYGIAHSTEGIVHPDYIGIRAATIKATYSSTVGSRVLPTTMSEELAHRIREDAHEYGATTGRPRDIVHLDLPALRYYVEMGGANALILTHLDIAYPDVPIQVCTNYTDSSGKPVYYRPDQDYLNTVKPDYIELPSWNGSEVRNAKHLSECPQAALQFIKFLTNCLALETVVVTTGPEREDLIFRVVL